MRLLLASVAVLLFTGSIQAQENPDPWEEWRDDLEFLAAELPARHPNPFANVEQDQWESAVSDLGARLRGMIRNQFGVELQRLVALIGDAHSSVNPQFDPVLSSRRYPMELYLFEDGLHVRSAAPGLEDIVGGKVVRIGNVDPGSAIAAVASTISYENTWWIRASAPERLVIPEVLDGLEMTNDPEPLRITVEKDGERTITDIQAVPVSELGGHGHGVALDKTGWIDMLESTQTPLWLQHPGDPMWYDWLEESETLYVCYRAIVSPHDGPSNREFWGDVFSAADRLRPHRMIIDIRENSGGNGMLNREVIQQIVRRPDLDRSDRLFVIIGRETFSAGQQLANQLDWWTQATFVGEPTGQGVSQYGDADRLVLPNSKISVFISTRFHQAPNPLDRRAFIPPDIYAPLTSQKYRLGVDPALDAVFANEDKDPLMAQINSALGAGQFEEAERLLISAGLDPANRYHDFETEINGIGYDLLGKGLIDAAVAVFLINSRVYPASANTFDSLGEALLRAGLRAEAVEAYTKALEIDPTLPSSLDALRRLQGDHQ